MATSTEILYELFDEVKALYKRSRTNGYDHEGSIRLVCSNLDGIAAGSGIRSRAFFANRLREAIVKKQVSINEWGFYIPKKAA